MVLQSLSAASIATAISVAFLNNNSFSYSNLLHKGSLARPHTNQSRNASSKNPSNWHSAAALRKDARYSATVSPWF